MFFPYTTDAPIYYFPFGTIGLIAVNVLVYFAVISGNAGSPENWILVYGDGIHPLQWFTSMFMHGDPMHLIGNMLFLWVFGLVVEGKLGWYRFVPCYLFIGGVQSALEQVAMQGYQGEFGFSLGASAAIYGIMAMAAVWAPKNEITFFYWFGMIFTGTFDVAIGLLAVLYVGYDLAMGALFGGSAMTSWLHISGAVIGFPLGIVLLKRGVVDCEGWDMFHVWRGDYGAFKQEPDLPEVSAKVAEKKAGQDAKQLSSAHDQLRFFLQHGNVDAATRLYDKMRCVGSGVALEREELFAMIRGLHKLQRWRDSAPLMSELIERFPRGTDAIRVKLAQICLVELQRPGKALELLQPIEIAKQSPELQQLAAKIAAKAKQMQMAGEVELDTEAW